MRQMPGITNFVPFTSKQYSAVAAMMNTRQRRFNLMGEGQSWLGRAASAEAMRRLLVTAIALERHRALHGVSTKALPDLVPSLLKTVPVDIMDGQPLRYRLTDDG